MLAQNYLNLYEIKNAIFRSLFFARWRKFVQTKYLTHKKWKSYAVKFIHNFMILSGTLCLILFAFSSNVNYKDPSINNFTTVTGFSGAKPNENVVESVPPVYNIIASWVRHGMIKYAVNGKRTLPVLSSLRDKSWLKYTKNELFSWSDVPVNFVNQVLEALDLQIHDGKNSSFGDWGKPVILPQTLVQDSKNKMSVHQLNVVASDIMSLNRRNIQLNRAHPSKM